MDDGLQSKVALVTGGATGIGLATVRQLLAEGCAVMIASRNREGGDAVVSDLGTERVAFHCRTHGSLVRRRCRRGPEREREGRVLLYVARCAADGSRVGDREQQLHARHDSHAGRWPVRGQQSSAAELGPARPPPSWRSGGSRSSRSVPQLSTPP
ncbi:SDR family NAD(P)-dependent oxidoreductase [Streptomyces sp. NPDC048337]|uniref:SDR family NAD(P)-dependent oxidoreductase n=1 Tax=Streptomyces sp. NPDC048337 TaxID=3365535 RepID=UPI003711270E